MMPVRASALLLRACVVAVLFGAAAAGAQTPASPAKKELVAKILEAQQPAIEQLARQIVEQPALQLLQRASAILQSRVAQAKREAVAREIQADARKYIEDTVPQVRQRAQALAPSTIGPVLEDKLTEDELREVLAVFQSPTWRKFQGLAPDMQKALGEKLVSEMRSHVETNLRALDQSLAKRLNIGPAAAASSAAPGK